MSLLFLIAIFVIPSSLQACSINNDCNDNSICTTDTCISSSCVYTPINCNDNDACTTDTCSSSTGCGHTPINCNDNDVCTTDTCISSSGCHYIPINCDDNSACTVDICDINTGCGFVLINCDDNNACTTDTCSSSSGCGHTPINCNDNNACTTDTCSSSLGCVYSTNSNSCIFYMDPNYQTNPLILCSNTDFVGKNYNDQISSWICGSNTMAVVYVDINYGGSSMAIGCGGKSASAGSIWDNSISSMKISSCCAPSDACTFYMDSNYQTNPLELCVSTSFVGNDYNDRISSWICGSNAKAVVYVDINYGGSSLSIGCGVKTAFAGNAWNDEISSIKITLCSSTSSLEDDTSTSPEISSNNKWIIPTAVSVSVFILIIITVLLFIIVRRMKNKETQNQVNKEYIEM